MISVSAVLESVLLKSNAQSFLLTQNKAANVSPPRMSATFTHALLSRRTCACGASFELGKYPQVHMVTSRCVPRSFILLGLLSLPLADPLSCSA